MPRISKRSAVLSRLDSLSASAAKHLHLLRLLGLVTADAEALLYRLLDLRRRVRSKRYLFRGPCRRRTPKFHMHLETDHDDSIDEREFKSFFRMSREAFWKLVHLLEEHGSLHRKTSDTHGSEPRPASHQLLVLFRYYGCEGNGGSSIALGAFFGVASGAIDSYKAGALEALLSLEKDTYFWPDASERRQTANRIEAKWLFPNCVGLIDGALLPLSARPLKHGQTYLSRKKFYAVVMLVACDDFGRILCCHVGWPGSVHDNRVWRNCSLFQKCQQCFSPNEYLLGDSAFTASAIMMPPYKALSGQSMTSNKSEFNALLAKPRVGSEHCIGIFKGRFPFFKSTRVKIKGRKSMKRLIDYTRGGATLHNFLMDDPVDEEWIDDDDEVEQLDQSRPEVNTIDDEPDYARRDEICFCLSELENTNIN